MKVAYTILLCLMNLTVFSQEVKVDSVTSEIKGDIPFDRVFYLPVIHDSKLNLTYLLITKKRHGRNASFTKKEIKRAKEVYGESFASESIKVDGEVRIRITLKKEKHHYISTKKGSQLKIFPLAPSTGYTFKVGFSNFAYSVDNRKRIARGEEILSNPRIESLNLSKYSITDTKTFEDSIDSDISHWIDSNNYEIAMSLLIFKDSTIEKEELITQKLRKLKELESNIQSVDFRSFIECYNLTLKSLSLCDSCESPNYLFNKQFDAFGYIHSDEKFLALASKGLYKINEPNPVKPVDEWDFPKRISNLIQTKSYIRSFLSNMQVSEKNCLNESLLDEIEKQIADLTFVLKEWEALIKLTADLGGTRIYSSSEIIGFSGGATTLDSKGKYRVRPDLGVSLASDGSLSRVLLSAGVRFNFRPLDPNLPYRQILMKSWAHRSSIGVTLTSSVSNGVTRFDLIGKQNLLVDYGIRLNNAFSISFGALIFKRKDPNPFITSQKLAVLPTIGISLDFEIINAIKEIKDALIK